MTVNSESIEAYLDQLTPERREVVKNLREAIRRNLPEGFEERVDSGMLHYVVPHTIFPGGYHCNPSQPLPFLSLASQKNFVALYHMGMYAMPELLEWFQKEYAAVCKYKLDMGKSCVRFKKMDDIPYELIGNLAEKVTVQDWITTYKKAFLKG